MKFWIGVACASMVCGGPSAATAAAPLNAGAIAEQLLRSYADPDRQTYLDNLVQLQIAAGRYADALVTLARLNGLHGNDVRLSANVLNLRWELYARAKEDERRGQSFDRAFEQEAESILAGVDGVTAYRLFYTLETPLPYLESQLDAARERLQSEPTLSPAQELDFVRRQVKVSIYRAIAPIVADVAQKDDQNRYHVELDRLVGTSDGGHVCVHVIRPRGSPRVPALLKFTIYNDRAVLFDEARLNAAHGYAGVIGLTRGKGCSPDPIVPIKYDGMDADAVIEWIARQQWSDGRVGMYGGSYEGFVQWAAAKRPPRALKAIMPAVSFSPGTDAPMEGQIFHTDLYPWPFYTTDNKTLDDDIYFSNRWNELERTWYSSGRAYRDLDRIDGKPNPIFNEWLQHPAFDQYWRSLLPTDSELKRLRIPVLTVTGFYDSGMIGALSYYRRLERLNPRAAAYLVVGPWDHHRVSTGTIDPLGNVQVPVLRGYTLDPVGQLDAARLRFDWYDWLFKHRSKPAVLRSKVNYELMGANVWRQSASIGGMSARKKRYWLDTGGALSSVPHHGATDQRVNLQDRGDVHNFVPEGPMIDEALDDWPIVSDAPNLANSLVFVSEPLRVSTELSGLFSGHLHGTANLRDFDVAVTIFELTPQRSYVHLAYFWLRASYARDRSKRTLLKPGQPFRIPFEANRLMGRLARRGSRIVVVLSIIKQPGEQINYGTGKDVSRETIADAHRPLEIRWFADSYIDIPKGRRS